MFSRHISLIYTEKQSLRTAFLNLSGRISEKFLFPYARGESYQQREEFQSAEEHIK